MKEEEPHPSQHFTQKVVEHPPLFYGINEVYSIRKESINSSNDQIYKRLSRQFQRIKKIKAEPNCNAILINEYDYENNPIRRDFKKLHDLYNVCSKTPAIVKKRIEKMRQKVDRIKGEVEKDEFSLVKEVDLTKLLAKSTSQTQPVSQNIPSNGGSGVSAVTGKQK